MAPSVLDLALTKAIMADDVNAVRAIPLLTLQRMLLPPIKKIITDLPMPPMILAAHSRATRCLKYFLTVPDIEVNIGVQLAMSGDPVPGNLLTPFGVAVNMIFDEQKAVTEEETEFARILARDSRTDVNVIESRSDGKFPAIVMIQVLWQQAQGILPNNGLLMDILHNPNLNVNEAPKIDAAGTNHVFSAFISMILNKTMVIFMEIVKHPKLDLDMHCPRGYNALHYAVETSIPLAVAELLEVMSPKQINRLSNVHPDKPEYSKPLRAYRVVPSDDREHEKILMLFMKCPKVELDGDLLGLFIGEALKSHKYGNTRRYTVYSNLVDALLAHPNFNMDDVVGVEDEELMKFYDARGMPDVSVFMEMDVENVDIMPNQRGDAIHLLHDVVDLQYTLPLIVELVKSAQIRNMFFTQLSDDSMTAVHRVIKSDKSNALRVLLQGIGGHVKSIKKESLLQYAKRVKAKKCTKLIGEFERAWMKKVTVVEHGHVFVCC